MNEFKSIQEQKKIWASVLNSYDSNYANQWGNPYSVIAHNVRGDILGNYLKIGKQFIEPYVTNKLALEIGSFTGKWSGYFGCARKIMFGDIIHDGFQIIKQQFVGSKAEIVFKLLNGYDLTGIADQSIDFIFSMDTLVRSEPEIIFSYLKEFKRVLRPGGNMCVHLPCNVQHLSHELGFTPIVIEDYHLHLSELWRDHYIVDLSTINHGILLRLEDAA